MSDEKYEQLKATFENTKTDHAAALKTVGNLFLNGENLMDAGVIVSNATIGQVGLLSLFTALNAPVLAGGLTALSMGTAAGRLYQGRSKEGDSQDVKGLKAEFKKAAGGFFAKQAASIVFMAVSFLAYDSLIGAGLHGGGQGLFPVALISGIAAGGLGLWARSSNKKMNVYDAAIRKAQLPPPAPAA